MMVRLIDAVGINLEIVLVMSETDNTTISLRPFQIVHGSSICRAYHLSLPGIAAFPRQQCT